MILDFIVIVTSCPEMFTQKRMRHRKLIANSVLDTLRYGYCPHKRKLLAWRVLAIVLLDLLRVYVSHEELVEKPNAQSQKDSVGGGHGESLKRRHASIVSADTSDRHTGYGAGPEQPLVVVYNACW
jgi:hypothetical protein